MLQLKTFSILKAPGPTFKTFLGLMFILLTASSAGAENIIRRGFAEPFYIEDILTSNRDVRRKYDEAFTQAIHREGDDIFKDLVQDIRPYSHEVSESLNKIRKKIPGMTFSKGQGITTSAKNMSCMMSDDSTWVVHPGNRPHVTIGRVLHEDLFVHEIVSAAGIIDDEYQVTGPILGARDLIESGDLTPDLAKILLGSVAIQHRQGTPQYKIKLKNELCYDGNGELISESTGGTATGIGGGGNQDALQYKKILISSVSAWWRKRHQGGKPINAAFIKKVMDLGVEPLVLHRRLIKQFPLQMAFSFSKRSGKLVARFNVETTLEQDQYIRRATDMILNHIYEELSSKKPFAYSNCVYGVELAENLELVSSETFNQYWTNEDREPFGVKKFCFR